MRDFSSNTLQFDLTPQDISKISIALCTARIVTIIDLHYLLKLLYKLKGRKIHSIKMTDFLDAVKFCVLVAINK